MGGFILAQVAAQDARLRAVVLESSPSDFEDYLNIHNSKWSVLSRWPARFALRNSGLLSRDDSALLAVGRISPRPVLIIAQADDPEIPASMTRKLEQAARAPKQLWLMQGTRHGGYEEASGADYPHRLRSFFEDTLL
jgi:fermentation-respiration switch protein FrsA (DUF1100 family)